MEVNKQKWAVHNEVYITLPLEKQSGQYHWGNVLYIMEINKQRNGQFTMRFIYSLPLGKRFIYNGDKQTEEWAVHNEVYIHSSIGETFYI